MENSSLRDQLRRLGLQRGVQGVKSPPPRRQALEQLLPGEVVSTACGSIYLHREEYPLETRQGIHSLARLLDVSSEAPARLARDARLAGLDLSRFAFLDTETTGLAGGTGTYAFLVGVGVFEGDTFVIHQFFMRDLHEEPAQLQALSELLGRVDALVTFNGKQFDLPLLETRYIMARQPSRLRELPHLDLLPPARRLWAHRLESCALSSLEAEILGVRRVQADVPGWLIPSLYLDYLRSGDAREIVRVFYHNVQDILSLVTLAAHQCDLVAMPLPSPSNVPGEDLYGVGRILQDLGELDRAEAAFTQAAQFCSLPQVQEMTMRELAYLLKRQGRRSEAVPWWQQLAQNLDAVYACEELAKYYEWHALDLPLAIVWTQQGIALAQRWTPGSRFWPGRTRQRETLTELHHRLARLQRKQDGSAPAPEADGEN
jgi:hypothetical protein